MVLVIADRQARLSQITDRIAPDFLRPDRPYWCGRLSDPDIERIIDKLHSRGRLGQITRFTRDNQRAYFVKTSGRRLFDAMADLEGGPGFKERIRSVYSSLPTDQVRTLYAAACLCFEHAIPLPTGIGAEVSGIFPRDLRKIIERDCNGVLGRVCKL